MSLGSRKGAEISGNSQVIWNTGSLPHSFAYGRNCASVQFSSVAQSCPTLCDPMNRSTPGLPIHHQLPEFTQTHVHHVSDAIQPSHPLLFLSPPAPKPSQKNKLLCDSIIVRYASLFWNVKKSELNYLPSLSVSLTVLYKNPEVIH